MSSSSNNNCMHKDLVGPYVLAALERSEAQSMAAHLSTCMECWQEYKSLSPVSDVLTRWRRELPPPVVPMWERLLQRIETQPRKRAEPAPRAHISAETSGWTESRWEDVAPGISCKLLATDVTQDRVSMLVRLEKDASYPPHEHAGVEELYLLQGELWIDDRQLAPGDYNRAEPGTSDRRVWSPTGCMCLLITSPSDQLR